MGVSRRTILRTGLAAGVATTAPNIIRAQAQTGRRARPCVR